MEAHLSTVVINSESPERLITFWVGLLGVEVRHSEPAAGFTWLSADRPGGVAIAVQAVATKLATHTDTHLDIAVSDLDQAQADTEALGGSLVAIRRVEDFEWRVMADPDGNEFCLFTAAHE